MNILQKSSKTEPGESAPPVGADDLCRRSLRLRAEREIDRNMTAGYGTAGKKT